MSLYVLEGLDGSGKGTQFKLLMQRLINDGENCIKIDFPNYESNSSALVKMYLNGEFSQNPKDVNAYAVSTFYAVDRFASFQKDWKQDYLDGKTIIANRYVSSNIVFQMTKLPKDKWDKFISWLDNLEHEKFGLPRADKVIYLDMPIHISQKLMSNRYDGDESKKDIHESNLNFLQECRECALYAAKKLDWTVINCGLGDKPRTIDDISDELYNLIKNL
ncbi:MAG: deoxynucleoside kinase [Clostridia bacterium]